MLVLSRQRDETIMIGDNIELTVVDIRGDKVRIGIKAPPEVAVHRKEIYEAIKRENEQSAALSEKDFGSLRSEAKPKRKDQPPTPAAGRLRRRNPPPKRETA